MKNNGSQTCRQGEEIVSYIYNELSPLERRSFESHIVGCNSCTGELGALSDARLSVYEWHREKFDPLPTPQFAIPYENKKGVAVEGFFEKLAGSLKGILDIARSPLAVTSILLVCLGVGFVAFNYLGGITDEFAANNSVPPPVAVDTIAPVPDDGVLEVASTSLNQSGEVDSDELEVGLVNDNKRIDTAIKAKASKRSANAARKPAGMTTNRTPVRKQEQAPLLSDYREIEDETLRLTDLLEMVGG